jgi:aspartyl-tRNA(Asn)/glutamyl-tRNA(Gln) amidotransferase subunit A
MDHQLAFATIDEIAAGYRAGAYTALEATAYFLGLLSARGADLNAIACLLEDRATGQARHLDRETAEDAGRAALWGIPYGVKDMFSTVGAPTMNGSRIRLPTQFSGDAAIIRQLAGSGAILTAKLALQEFGALHSSDPARASAGATRNPWDLGRWSGGSSSGAGAAVAAGLLPFAIGAESGGSIAFPSSYCGLTGLRPTFGRISREGATIVCWSLDKIGPMAHSATDCRKVLDVLAPDNRLSFGREQGTQALGWLRLGWAEHDFEEAAWPEIRPAIRDGLRAFVDLGATLVSVALPSDIPYLEAISVIAIGEAAEASDEIIRSDDFGSLSIEQQAGILAAQGILAKDYIAADRVRAALESTLARIFEHVDAIASFVTPWPAPPIGQMFEGVPITKGTTGLIAAGNLVGLPAVFVPCGLTETGLPVGLQIVGPPDSERLLLDAVEMVQTTTSWHRLRPPEPIAPSLAPAARAPEPTPPDDLVAKIASERVHFEEFASVVRTWVRNVPDEPAMRFLPRLSRP